MSMVPLADIFNHKAAIVQLSDDYVIEPTCYECSDSGSDSGTDGEYLGSAISYCHETSF